MSNRATVCDIATKGHICNQYLRIAHDKEHTLAATFLLDYLSINDYAPVRFKKAGNFLHVFFLVGSGGGAAYEAAEYINKKLTEINDYLEQQKNEIEQEIEEVDQFLQEQTKQPKQPRWKVTANIITDRTGSTRTIKTIIEADTEKYATDLAYKEFKLLDTERINYVYTEKL